MNANDEKSPPTISFVGEVAKSGTRKVIAVPKRALPDVNDIVGVPVIVTLQTVIKVKRQ